MKQPQNLNSRILLICIIGQLNNVLDALVQRRQKPGDVLAEMQVVCNSDAILLKVMTNKPFNGMVYAKDASSGRNCMSEYISTTNMTYRLPLKSCGTSFVEVDDGIEYYNTLVVQPHMRLMTNQGRSYHVRCKYLTREPSVSNIHFNVSASFLMSNNQLPASAPIFATASMPSCTMKIFKSGRDDVADAVKIGDKLSMVIEIDQQDIYGMRVSNCMVRDGINSIEQQLIDEQGCPVDELIMPKFDYTNNFTRASVSFLAHKFPHTSSVYYQCNVRLCINNAGCSHSNCPASSTPFGSQQRRRKRFAVGPASGVGPARVLRQAPKLPELSFDVYSGLHVDDLDNGGATDSAMSDPADEKSGRSYCTSASLAILALCLGSVAVAAMLAIHLGLLGPRDQQVSGAKLGQGLPVGARPMGARGGLCGPAESR